MDLDDAELETQLRDALHRAAEPVHGEGIFKETIRHEAARRQAGRRRARWTGRLALAAAAAAAAVLSVVVLTRPDQDRVDTDGGPLATQPTAPPTTKAEPAPNATDTTPAGPSTTLPTTTSTPTSTPTTAPPEVELPAFPPELTDLTHRGEAWGLYLAVAGPGQYDAPELVEAGTWAEDAGYGPTGAGDLGCDEGAAEALGADTASPAVVVYFRTQAEAEQARAAFEARGHAVAGVAHVLTGCMD